MQTKTIHVRAYVHKKTGLLMAYSDDLPGLLVPGRTEEELEERIPGAIEEILQAQGFRVISITTEREESELPEAFRPPAFIAAAQLENMVQ